MERNLDTISNIVDQTADISVMIEKVRTVGIDINAYLDTENEPDAFLTVYRKENKIKSDIQLDYLLQVTEAVEKLLRYTESIYNRMMQEQAK